MAVEFGALIKDEIEKQNFPFFRAYVEAGEFYAINFHYFRDGGRVEVVNKR